MNAASAGCKSSQTNGGSELTQTNFSRTINIPNVACDACVLRTRYVSNNPLEDPQGHGPTFYQCADVKFVASDAAPAPAVATPAPVATETTDKSCCAPATFTTSFTMDKPMTKSKGVIYYDADNKMMREDVVHGDGTGTTATNGRFTIISNFTRCVCSCVRVPATRMLTMWGRFSLQRRWLLPERGDGQVHVGWCFWPGLVEQLVLRLRLPQQREREVRLLGTLHHRRQRHVRLLLRW